MQPKATLAAEALIEGRKYRRPTQAVILAGGRGTRMRPITNERPKPMISILGRPFLEYQIEQLRDQGFERVLLLLGYLPQVVQSYFGDGARWGIKIEYSVTGADDLTSSRVRNARHRLDPCFLLLYCDNYWPMQIDRMWQRFCSAAKPGMITVYSNTDQHSRGSVILDANDDVLVYDRLRTTPGLQGVEISYAILTDRVVDLLPEQDTLFEEAIYTPLAKQGRLAAYVSDHRYYSVGSLDRLPKTEAFLRRDPTIILDRDGVLNCKPPRAHYVTDWTGWRWLPGALEALRMLRLAGYRVFVASNQAGINRGAMSLTELSNIHARMCAEAETAGGHIEAVFFCPHDWDEGCACRKPKPGLLLQLQKEFDLDLTRTLCVGDDERDATAALAAGCPFAKITSNRSLLQVVRQLLASSENTRPLGDPQAAVPVA